MLRIGKWAPSHGESDEGHVYWHDGLAPLISTRAVPLESVEVAVIGSGYTGLHAAIVTARAGRSTQVIDKHMPGWGCSTRNGGQISPSIKPTLATMTRKYGANQAMAIRDEGYKSLDWIDNFITREKIDCHFKKCGRFQAAHTPAHFDALVRDTQKLGKEEGVEFKIVPRDDQRKELGTDSYYGGVMLTNHASLDPAKYYVGLLKKAKLAGAEVTGNCPAQDIRKDHEVYIITTPKGEIRAKNIIIATNGYINKNADESQLKTNSCHFVTSTQALEYVPDVDPALDEITRILRPRGAFVNVSILWDHFKFHGADEKLNEKVHEAFRAHCSHQMLPMELPGKLTRRGFENIKDRSLAVVITRRDDNSPARYSEAVMANFALTQGVSAEEVSDWKSQLERAEKQGRFGFTSFPVLTSAHLS